MKPVSIGMMYEITLAVLVVISLVAEFPEPYGQGFDLFIWGLFVIDYSVRLSLSEKKWEFVKQHPLDLIAILPLDQIFRAARIVRLLRIIRLLSILNRKGSMLHAMFERYNVDRLLVFVTCVLFLAALSMKWIEPTFETYGDALWWAVVTTTTVGYGDLYPETTVGRIIATVLMFIGIGLIAVVTGTITTLFSKRRSTPLPLQLQYVQNKLDDYPSVSEEEWTAMIEHLQKTKDTLYPK